MIITRLDALVLEKKIRILIEVFPAASARRLVEAGHVRVPLAELEAGLQNLLLVVGDSVRVHFAEGFLTFLSGTFVPVLLLIWFLSTLINSNNIGRGGVL